MMFDPARRSVLTQHDLGRFAGDTLFERIARTVCRAGCLPRKELYESWEVARRVRRRYRGGRVVDLACGHALTTWILLILDGSSPSALGVDVALPESAARLSASLAAEWPALASRISTLQADVSSVALVSTDLVVSIHACGALSDVVLERALSARARVAILPCCHDTGRCDTGGLDGWLEPGLAIDVTRAARLRQAGYVVHTQIIPRAITPKNRLLLASPG